MPTGQRPPRDPLTSPLTFRDDLLKDQVVLVSGAGSGIGKAIAIQCARLGARLAICGRKVERLEETAAILRGLGLKPAEKDRETGAVKLWRFPAQRTHEPTSAPRNGHTATPALAPSGPFAGLAELMAPQPASHRRRRRHKRPAVASPKAAT